MLRKLGRRTCKTKSLGAVLMACTICPQDSGYLLPGANVGALVARIGDDGPIFAVGSRCDFIADRAGLLNLAMNENPSLNNQAGKIVAQVIVFSQP